MRKKLLLIQPPFIRKTQGQMPLQLACLAAACKKSDPDIQIKIVDMNIGQSLSKSLKTFHPTHVGLTRYTPNNIECLDILKNIKKIDRGIVLISGGPHEWSRSKITNQQNPWLDYVVSDRDGEQKLVNIINKNEAIKINWQELFPAYHLLDTKESSYRFNGHIFPRKKMLVYLSARGCSLNCSFCPAGNYQAIPTQIVLAHLKRIVDLGYQAIFFNDVNFGADPKRTQELVAAIIKKGLNKKLTWGCQTTANELLSDDLINLMAKAGCSYIVYSLETVSPQGLSVIHKKLNPIVVTHKSKVAKKNKMQLGLYVMFGIHQNEQEDFYWTKKTLDQLEKICPNYVSYSILADYPHTRPDLDWEGHRFGTEKIWQFFDEGTTFHPYCSVSYAQKIKAEILARHNNNGLYKTIIF